MVKYAGDNLKKSLKMNKKNIKNKLKKMKKLLVILFYLPLIIFAQENIKFSKTIIVGDLQKHLNILASDSLEGRETGKAGQKMAADYIMNHFKNIGIPPYKKKTYYQKFKVKSGVERFLGKEEVMGSIPIIGSKKGKRSSSVKSRIYN